MNTTTVSGSISWIFYNRPSKSLKASEKIDCYNWSKGCPGNSNFTAAGIPESLSLDKILRNECCSPCSIVDMVNYLRFIEHSPEHLEFYLWHEDYTKKFEALSPEEKARSPVWTARVTSSSAKEGEQVSKVSMLGSDSPVSRGGSFDEKEGLVSPYHSKKPSLLPEEFASQPFRAEISRIIPRYITVGSPRELNISARDRENALHALSYTTHPSALLNLKSDCETYLRHQSHPNFIRWVIANCTKPRVDFAYTLATSSLLLGVLISLLLTLTSVGRAWRLFGAILWLAGALMLACAWKGICIVLMAIGHRRLLEPWEIPFEDVEDDKGSITTGSFDDVIPENWNDAPWVLRDKKKSWLRKVFGETVRVEDPQIRKIQNIILFQGAAIAIVATIPFIIVFMAIPPGHLI